MHENKEHLTSTELLAGLPHIMDSPKNMGPIELMVIRPAVNERKVVNQIDLSFKEGCRGDIWPSKKSSSNPFGKPDLEKQITLMNARAIDLCAGSKDLWPLAGDQIYVDMDLSIKNIEAGTELQLGTAVIKVSAKPHNGCKKFTERFGIDSMRFVNSEEGKALRLRGINAYVVREGIVKLGDKLTIL
jgi:hypothetical protein